MTVAIQSSSSSSSSASNSTNSIPRTIHLGSEEDLEIFLKELDLEADAEINEKLIDENSRFKPCINHPSESAKKLSTNYRIILYNDSLFSSLPDLIREKERFLDRSQQKRFLDRTEQIKPIDTKGYCHGASEFFIYKYQQYREMGVGFFTSLEKAQIIFRDGVPKIGVLLQIFYDLNYNKNRYYSQLLTIKDTLNDKRNKDLTIKAIKDLPNGAYLVILSKEGARERHDVCMIKDFNYFKELSYEFFDINQRWDGISNSYADPELRLFEVLKNKCQILDNDQDGNKELSITFEGPSIFDIKKYEQNLQNQNIFVIDEVQNIAPNITLKKAVQLTTLKKLKILCAKSNLLTNAVYIVASSIIIGGIKAIPSVSFSRWIIVPIAGNFFSLSSHFFQLKSISRKIFPELENTKVMMVYDRDIKLYLLYSAAISLGSETFLSPSSTLAKVAVTATVMFTSFALRFIVEESGIKEKCAKVLNYGKEKVKSAAKSTFSALGAASVKTKSVFGYAATIAKSVVGTTANFFRGFCYSN